jgi:hypothetical protein
MPGSQGMQSQIFLADRIATTPLTRNTMAAVFLDNQIFYTPSVVLGATPTSHYASARHADVSAAISGAAPIPLPSQDAHGLRHSGPGDSPDDALLISDNEPNCDDLDNYGDDRSDTSFPTLDELLAAPRNHVGAPGACLTFSSLK